MYADAAPVPAWKESEPSSQCYCEYGCCMYKKQKIPTASWGEDVGSERSVLESLVLCFFYNTSKYKFGSNDARPPN